VWMNYAWGWGWSAHRHGPHDMYTRPWYVAENGGRRKGHVWIFSILSPYQKSLVNQVSVLK
jgi:hypothetical protein